MAIPLPTRAEALLILRRRRASRTLPAFADFAVKHGLTLTRPVMALAALAERIAAGEELRAVITMPPRHGKTDTTLRIFAWLLATHPDRMNVYATYAQRLANSKSRRARRFAEAAGVRISPGAANLAEWRTPTDGGLIATGIGGPLTGQGATGVAVIDDPIKNRSEAESALVRETVWEWYTDVFYTRLEPGASVLVPMTRWHPDDLAGRLIDDGYELIHLPALDDDGVALWPEKYSAERLLSIKARVGEYTWASLYQGSPKPKGATVFKGTHLYDDLPTSGYRVAIGFDAAYSGKNRADYSVALTGRAYRGRLYLTSMIRKQAQADVFAAEMKARGIRHVHWIRSSTEEGLELFLRKFGIAVSAVIASTDKHARAQPAAADWNAGNILVPSEAASTYGDWVEELVNEVLDFTGVKDRHDDTVDALAALHDATIGNAPAPYRMSHARSERAGIAR